MYLILKMMNNMRIDDEEYDENYNNNNLSFDNEKNPSGRNSR